MKRLNDNEKRSGCLFVLIFTVLFWIGVIWLLFGCAHIVPHKPGDRRGMYVTPHGVYHKSVLLNPNKKYEKQ